MLALSQGIEHYDSLFEDKGAYEDAEGALKQHKTSVWGDAAVPKCILCSVPVHSTQPGVEWDGLSRHRL